MKKNFLALFLLTACVSSVSVVKSSGEPFKPYIEISPPEMPYNEMFDPKNNTTSDIVFGFVGASALVASVAKWRGFADPFVKTVAPLMPNLSGITSLPYVDVVAKGACAGLTYAGSYAGAGLTYAGSYACAFYGLPMLVLVKYSYDMYCMKDQITKDKIPLLEITKKIFKKNCNLVINTIVPVAKLAGGLVILGMLAAKK